LTTQLQANPAAFKAEETTRMQTVMKNFSVYKTVEMLLLFHGVGLVALWQRHDLAAGVGIGLVLQAAFTLTLDIFAEARGQTTWPSSVRLRVERALWLGQRWLPGCTDCGVEPCSSMRSSVLASTDVLRVGYR
jgi:hypothetical protein